MKTSVVIPNWNGRKLLEKNLPKVLEVGFDEIIVVDDASQDNSMEYLKAQSSKLKANIKILQNTKNLGFSRTVNRGVKETKSDIVFLLNTDVAPQKDILKPVLEDFKKDKNLFAVSLSEEKFGWNQPRIENGFLNHQSGGRAGKKHKTFWVNGGSGAVRKTMWESLGGLDMLFSPFYWEDVDLSYRALKRGWEIIWEPKARVSHEHEATINEKTFNKKYLNYIKERNQLLFHWKNLDLKFLLTKHLLGILIRLRNPGYAKVFLGSLLKLISIIVRRIKESGKNVLTDEQIIAKFK